MTRNNSSRENRLLECAPTCPHVLLSTKYRVYQAAIAEASSAKRA